MTKSTDEVALDLDTLVTRALGDQRAAEKLRHLLKLDELNWTYFKALYQLKKTPTPEAALRIVTEENPGFTAGFLDAFPTAIAPPELLKLLPCRYYESLLTEADHYRSVSRSCSLWIKKAQAGAGTSVTRESYLKNLFPEQTPILGSKGTDLFITYKDRVTSLAEIQILQAIRDAKTGTYAKVFFQDIVNTESKDALAKLWATPSLVDPALTYKDISKKISKFVRFGEVNQSVLPTLDRAGKLSLNRLAPGGHAFFAVDALLSALHPETLPPAGDTTLISVIGNGEDLGSSPDGVIVGWMAENRIPIVMITTEKTEIDLKGGQIALVKEPDGFVSVALIEQAQAKQAGQLELFEKLGVSIKKKDQQAFFNTNVALFNYSELSPRLKKLQDKVGKDELLKILTPSLIENKKEQIDSDGQTRQYEQLEGAMGSTILNLDRAWRRHFGEPLVHFVNIEKAHRTRFFSPIKTPFDFFMLFFSDRFSLDQQALKLLNKRPGSLPVIKLGDPAYNDVQTTLEAFRGTRILKLDSLEVEGQVKVPSLTLEGRVHIVSEYGSDFDLSPHASVLKDQKVEIDSKGEVRIREI